MSVLRMALVLSAIVGTAPAFPATSHTQRVVYIGGGHFPAWSPRGDRILFTGFRTGDFEIYTIRPDVSGLRQLTHDHGNDAHAIWSPDGKSILFTSSRMGWKDETGGGQSYGEIFVMREDGTHLRQLTDDQWEESADAWLPPARRQ